MAIASQSVDSDRPLLRLQTFGAVALRANNSDVILGAGKPLALLVFLAFAPGRRTSRETLIDMLWSDLEPERARPALRQTLFQLRRLLGDDSITGTEELALTVPIEIDRDEFLLSLEVGNFERAMSWYCGPFLPAFAVPGGASFEQWADLERGRLESGFIRGAELLVRRNLNQSRFKDAKQYARQSRELAPHKEATGRLLLEALVAGREHVAASLEADNFEQWARTEDMVLESASRIAIDRARRVANAQETTKGHLLIAELTGRAHEFFAITSAWESVRAGAARHVHLSAPAGLGKTRLMHDVVTRLRAAGATVIQLRGMPGDRDVPYAFAADLVAALSELPGAAGIAPASASALLALNPAMSTRLAGAADLAQGEEALRRRTLAVTDLVHAVAGEKRFVLAIDDLHWMDSWSFRMFEGVCARLAKAHVLCLTAARPERTPSDERCVCLPLSALTFSQTEALVTALGAIPTHETWATGFVSGLHDATRGSPLLLLETLRLMLDEQTLVLENNEWSCRDQTKLASLLRAGEALRERIRSLPKQQSWMLAVLAAVGTPVTRHELASVAGVTDTELSALNQLERQGLATLHAAKWFPAHDEIAEAARSALSEDERIEIERALGEHLTRVAGLDQNVLLRAARHLQAAGEQARVRSIFARYATVQRERGDRRAYAVMASDFTRDDRQLSQAAALVAGLPKLWRIGLWSRSRQLVAAGVMITLPVIGMAVAQQQAVTEERLQKLVLVDSAKAITVIPMRSQDFDGRTAALSANGGRAIGAEGGLAFPEKPPAFSPDQRSVAWNQDSGDSTTIDIWMRTPAGLKRLVHNVRDDVVTGWLPDGSALIGLTNQWSPRIQGNYDVAIYDTATGTARQITHGPAHDGNPVVSPDGARVAFMRESDEFPVSLCVIGIDGVGEPECRRIGGRPVAQLLGWSGLAELTVILDGIQGTRPLVVYDWARDSQRTILGPNAIEGRQSPDRQWVVATLHVNGIRGFQNWVAPLDRPSQARRIASSRTPNVIRWFEGAPDQSSLVDHIEFTDTASTALLGVSTRLRVRSLTTREMEVPLFAPVRWASGDTLIATVDSLGDLRPRTPGTVTIAASLAGWRRTSKRIRVVGEPVSMVMRERWDDSWKRRWIPWGNPAPTLAMGPEKIRGFWNNGDGSYDNMAVSRQAISARQGLGIEVRISSPVTRTIEQRVQAYLIAGVDTSALIATNQRNRAPAIGGVDERCGINFPSDGRLNRNQLSVVGSSAEVVDLGEDGRALRSGAWWTLRLQILPDGRCGIAINNRVIWISSEALPLDAAYRVRLGNDSQGTRIIHGPLDVWTGVRTDLVWANPKY